MLRNDRVNQTFRHVSAFACVCMYDSNSPFPCLADVPNSLQIIGVVCVHGGRRYPLTLHTYVCSAISSGFGTLGRYWRASGSRTPDLALGGVKWHGGMGHAISNLWSRAGYWIFFWWKLLLLLGMRQGWFRPRYSSRLTARRELWRMNDSMAHLVEGLQDPLAGRGAPLMVRLALVIAEYQESGQSTSP